MIDSFITYDSNQNALGSPSYFGKNFDDMFRFSFPEGDAETYNLLQSQPSPPENNEQAFPKEAAFEVFSSHSGFSTNPSIKHSPEYVASPEQGGDDDQYARPTKSSGVMKKGIRKQYEPIVDNNIVYRYEEDPSEYRKARKRIQNRESATRVRNRKKTHVEELEDEMDIIRKERAELKVHNASLVAENNMLKQQITFLERIVSSRNYPEDMIDNSDPFHNEMRTENSDSMLQLMNKTSPSDSILQFMNKSDEDGENSQPACKYFRAAPTHQFKKQVALLGVFTLLLCVYGLMPRSEPISVSLFSRTSFGKTNTLAFAYPTGKSASTSSDGLITNHRTITGFGKWVLDWSVEILVIISYIVCLVYVGIKGFKHHQQKKKQLVLSPL